VGAALYHRFFHDAAQRGAHTVQCITSPGNTTSLAFHTRLGFSVQTGDTLVDGVPVQPDYDGPGLDRIVFTRELDTGTLRSGTTRRPPHAQDRRRVAR
jgi:hypothetical protein